MISVYYEYDDPGSRRRQKAYTGLVDSISESISIQELKAVLQSRHPGCRIQSIKLMFA